MNIVFLINTVVLDFLKIFVHMCVFIYLVWCNHMRDECLSRTHVNGDKRTTLSVGPCLIPASDRVCIFLFTALYDKVVGLWTSWDFVSASHLAEKNIKIIDVCCFTQLFVYSGDLKFVPHDCRKYKIFLPLKINNFSFFFVKIWMFFFWEFHTLVLHLHHYHPTFSSL